MDTEVKIEAVAANPDKWSKTYTLLPATRQGAEFTVSVPLDLKQFAAVFDTIQQETGLAASNEELTVLATVHAVAQTAQGTDRQDLHPEHQDQPERGRDDLGGRPAED